jgi:polar amino acid transport system substrate-binding protein
MAILDEPPFCWLDADGTARGCDVEVARIALQGAGFDDLRFQVAQFDELVPGVLADRWQLNTGMFVTPERAMMVRFTRPIWSVPDGVVLRAADVGRFSSYADLAADPQARVAVVVGQVQGEAARAAGVPAERMLTVATQAEAVQAVLAGAADAAASTAIGNRALLKREADPRLAAVEFQAGPTKNGESKDAGAFSVHPANTDLAVALDTQLAVLLGSTRHREIIRRYGLDGGAGAPTPRITKAATERMDE